MNKLYRILIVIILIMVVAVIALDYFGFHGSIIMNSIGGGAAVGVLDAILKLFEGPNASSNLAFVAVISIGLLVCVMAIIYKFIKG